MPYKTRRQARYERLRICGFTGFEARALSRVSVRVPYMMPLMKKRLVEYNRAKRQAQKSGLTEVDFNKRWLTHIKRQYIMKGWKHKGDRWGVTVAFRMLKAKEKEYKYKHPQYESPWQKTQKQWHDFIAKIDKSYEKYPKGYGKKWASKTLRYLPEGGAVEE